MHMFWQRVDKQLDGIIGNLHGGAAGIALTIDHTDGFEREKSKLTSLELSGGLNRSQISPKSNALIIIAALSAVIRALYASARAQSTVRLSGRI